MKGMAEGSEILIMRPWLCPRYCAMAILILKSSVVPHTLSLDGNCLDPCFHYLRAGLKSLGLKTGLKAQD